jgi:hypothetical protein
MANPDSVGQFNLDSFSDGRVAFVTATTLNATSNSGVAAVTLPILSGGMTKGAGVASSGSLIVRRVTIQNPSGSMANANISITTSNDGNISNAVVANVVLANVTATGTYQDLTIAPAFLSGNVVSGYNTQALYVNINAPQGGTNTCTIAVYGQVVSF